MRVLPAFDTVVRTRTVGESAVRPLFVVVIVIGFLLGATGFAAATLGTEAAIQQAQPEADNTVTRIHIHQDGSARWTVTIRTRLDSEQRVTEYRAFQSRFRNDTASYLDPFRTRMERVVARAANVTGRPMTARNFTASTTIQEVPRRWGIVTFQFTWTNFTASQDGRLVVGDVFQGGFFLSANDSLEIVAPAGYEIVTAEPEPDTTDTGVVTWLGREDFADRRPHVVLAPAAEVGQPRTPTGAGGGALGRGPLVGGLLVMLLGVGAYLFWSRRQRTGKLAGSAEDGSTPTRSDQVSSTEVSGGDDLSTVDPAEFATDGERAAALIGARGGRMRQADLAEEFGWSASKTSRVVSDLVDDGTVEKTRLGRENLLELVEHDDA